MSNRRTTGGWVGDDRTPGMQDGAPEQSSLPVKVSAPKVPGVLPNRPSRVSSARTEIPPSPIFFPDVGFVSRVGTATIGQATIALVSNVGIVTTGQVTIGTAWHSPPPMNPKTSRGVWHSTPRTGFTHVGAPGAGGRLNRGNAIVGQPRA